MLRPRANILTFYVSLQSFTNFLQWLNNEEVLLKVIHITPDSAHEWKRTANHAIC